MDPNLIGYYIIDNAIANHNQISLPKFGNPVHVNFVSTIFLAHSRSVCCNSIFGQGIFGHSPTRELHHFG